MAFSTRENIQASSSSSFSVSSSSFSLFSHAPDFQSYAEGIFSLSLSGQGSNTVENNLLLGVTFLKKDMGLNEEQMKSIEALNPHLFPKMCAAFYYYSTQVNKYCSESMHWLLFNVFVPLMTSDVSYLPLFASRFDTNEKVRHDFRHYYLFEALKLGNFALAGDLVDNGKIDLSSDYYATGSVLLENLANVNCLGGIKWLMSPERKQRTLATTKFLSNAIQLGNQTLFHEILKHPEWLKHDEYREDTWEAANALLKQWLKKTVTEKKDEDVIQSKLLTYNAVAHAVRLNSTMTYLRNPPLPLRVCSHECIKTIIPIIKDILTMFVSSQDPSLVKEAKEYYRRMMCIAIASKDAATLTQVKAELGSFFDPSDGLCNDLNELHQLLVHTISVGDTGQLLSIEEQFNITAVQYRELYGASKGDDLDRLYEYENQVPGYRYVDYIFAAIYSKNEKMLEWVINKFNSLGFVLDKDGTFKRNHFVEFSLGRALTSGFSSIMILKLWQVFENGRPDVCKKTWKSTIRHMLTTLFSNSKEEKINLTEDGARNLLAARLNSLDKNGYERGRFMDTVMRACNRHALARLDELGLLNNYPHELVVSSLSRLIIRMDSLEKFEVAKELIIRFKIKLADEKVLDNLSRAYCGESTSKRQTYLPALINWICNSNPDAESKIFFLSKFLDFLNNAVLEDEQNPYTMQLVRQQLLQAKKSEQEQNGLSIAPKNR